LAVTVMDFHLDDPGSFSVVICTNCWWNQEGCPARIAPVFQEKSQLPSGHIQALEWRSAEH